jgi:alanine racemase
MPIMVLHGAQIGQEDALAANQLVPVLNDLEQISRWRLFANKTGMTLPALLHFDTGMTRLGLDGDQADWLIQNRGALDGLDIAYVMSHLVSGEVADDPVNARQLASFNELRSWFAGVPASLANSAGCLLGKDYHFQMTRPGIALYGVHPLETRTPRPSTRVCLASANPANPSGQPLVIGLDMAAPLSCNGDRALRPSALAMQMAIAASLVAKQPFQLAVKPRRSLAAFRWTASPSMSPTLTKTAFVLIKLP